MMNLKVYMNNEEIKVKDAPIGLFVLEDGEIICISEYRSGPGDDQSKYTRDAYIVSSGENYCGGDEGIGYPLVIQ